MTVWQLIEELKKMPQDSFVYYIENDDGEDFIQPVDSIKLDEDGDVLIV